MHGSVANAHNDRSLINDVNSHLVPDNSFVDVGGLWGLSNERVTVAAKAGAARVAMIDIHPLGEQAWIDFDNHAKSHDVQYEAFSVILTTLGLANVSVHLTLCTAPASSITLLTQCTRWCSCANSRGSTCCLVR